MLPIKAKSDVFEAFKNFKAYAENQSRHRIKILRDDKGGEYISNAFFKFTTECGIERQHAVRARPQQNGVAERANRVLSERLTTMLDESGLAKAFWGEALGALVHVWNRCPTDASRVALLINCGLGQSLTSPTFVSGDALLMFTYRRIRERAWVLTWRSASLLATLKATRDGSSITPLRRRPSSQKELTLMRGTSLCPSTLQLPLSLLQV